ncbi:bifunctional aminoglycoside phosphotransferase/ATP-binding protein [Cupriavidus sp. AcVe19-1a]|uniref:bifunctional aminoglycoside phosphotransferase/ATP-binding protein n=1 Tax=Cupriavidus sp. AcVe19-1a TaxID=2821359 RepID=UPI001AE69A35|nr:bifunctional aminoglycoside phosphotransferase/ATP-binding protein [Cupriavidus sp. AcVe19-1a]MBP0630741.1 AAA family ATPase [Cupriavidus sp. AcVe19-1a]
MESQWDDAALTAALQQPDAYPHSAPAVQVIETHISRVFLAGDFAYKVRKPVRFDFVDFSTAQARLDDCKTELRLNRRFAPALYLDVVPIVTGSTPGTVRIGGSGMPIEHAVRMRRFDQQDLLSARVAAGRLEPGHIDALARSLAAFHQAQPPAAHSDGFGTPARLDATLAECLGGIGRLAQASHLVSRVGMRARSEAARLAGAFRARLRNGHVRECHGDLHLGNIVLLDGVPTPFDCLEFDAALRWTDTISDLAFPVMDLLHHGRPALAFRLLNGYLEQSGDYSALAVLPFYLAMRALVRARVLLEHACQQHAAGAPMAPAQGEAGRLLALAWRCLGHRRGAMVLMHGLSGSGKSTVAAQISEAGAMVRVRSDAVRKGMHRGVMPAGGWYAASETARTYRRLLAVCRLGCRAGFPMIADATFLVRAERERFAAQARRLGVPFAIVTCEASPETLRARIAARARAGRDLSDADDGVLAWQMRVQEPLTEAERAFIASPGSFTGRATPGRADPRATAAI